MSLRSDFRALKYFVQDVATIFPLQAFRAVFDRDFQARLDQAAYAHDATEALNEFEAARDGLDGGELPDYPGPRAEAEEEVSEPAPVHCEPGCTLKGFHLTPDGRYWTHHNAFLGTYPDQQSQVFAEWHFTEDELDLLGLKPGDALGPGIVGAPTDSPVASAPNAHSAVTSDGPAAGSSPRPAAGLSKPSTEEMANVAFSGLASLTAWGAFDPSNRDTWPALAGELRALANSLDPISEVAQPNK